tara:strand:+ start:485 stop:1096 length:612 start_codon:yes stop_codon:yes gene_type:complete
MKRSEFKKSIKEEIFDILEAVTQDDVKAQQDYNAELAKTAKLSKEAGLTENVNPEVHRLVNGFVKKMADRYDYSLQDAVNAMMQVLKSQNYDGVNEGNDTDKFQDDGYVDHKYDDQTIDKYNIPVAPTAVFEDEDEDDMDKKAMKSAKKGDSISKLASKLQQTSAELKSTAKKWKDAEGSEKEKLKDRLKTLTKIKKEIEGLL